MFKLGNYERKKEIQTNAMAEILIKIILEANFTEGLARRILCKSVIHTMKYL